MNKPHIKETINKALCYLTESDMTELQNLARSYLKALESGILTPETISNEALNLFWNAALTQRQAGNCDVFEWLEKHVYLIGDGVCDLMLPHLVARDERIRDLDEKTKHEIYTKSAIIEQLEADIKQKDEMIKQLENKLNEYQITNSKDETNKLREDIRKEVTQACASVWRNSINGLSAMGSIKNGMYQTVDNIVKSIVNWHAINCNEKEYKIKQLEAEVKRLKGEK